MNGPPPPADQAAPAPAPYTHLEVHSHYTLLGATPSIPELVARAQADELSALALTDTNALYGAVAFDRACRAADIRPLLGMTLTVAPPPQESMRPVERPGHLLLLADGPAGYRSLCRLSAHIQGRPDRESRSARGLDWDSLKANAEGIICLDGGRQGWINRYLRAGSSAAAGRYAARLGGLYGENAFLSLELPEAAGVDFAREVSALGQRFGLATVAVQPIYYLEPGDADRLRLLAAIDRNCPLDAVPPDIPGLDPWAGHHWLSPEAMTGRFRDFPEALARSSDIADRCRPALPDGRPIWPALKLPADQTPEAALTEAASAGLADRFGSEIPAEARVRLLREIKAINQAGFAPLFLVMTDVVRFAREAEIPVSTRGSVANSLVAYCLGITTVDPLANDLLFERFLNPSRANPPDIDLDFCSRRRDEVLTYVRQTYGEQRVALVATVSTLRPKSAVRETAKAYGLDETQISALSRRLPRDWHPDPRRRERKTVADLLAELKEDKEKAVIQAAYTIVGQPHHLSVHPGGVVITPGPLTDYVPVQWAPKGFLITQFGHQDIEHVGLPKLDLLGIRALTVLADTADWVRLRHRPDFHLADIPEEDPLTAHMLARGETIGVFQCESAGAQRTLRQLQAKNVADLAVANAFFKPGPAMGGMAQTFIRRYRGEAPVSFLHPALEPILASTQGVLIFQEQILRLATEIAGLSWDQADHLRRGMSKFKAQEMAAMQAQFVAGCRRPPPEGPGLNQDQAETLWEQVLPFAGYGFNRGHATAYADVSYRSAYLKAHWPAEFLCSRLADWGGFHHPAVYIAEAIRLGILVRPPHVNHSDRTFTLTYELDAVEERPILWMGLGQVRDLRRASVKAIVRARQERPFSGLGDLAVRVDLRGKELAHLVQCGALDGLGESRAALLAEAQTLQRAGGGGQLSFPFATLRVEPETPGERLAWEQRLLGWPVSVHPLDTVRPEMGPVTPLAQLVERRPGGRPVTVVGCRLAGWTGGPGFFLSDGRDFITVRGDKDQKAPHPWLPLRLRGRWSGDEWGGRWLQAEEMAALSETAG